VVCEDRGGYMLALKMRGVPPATAAALLRQVADKMEAERSSGGTIEADGQELVVWLWDHDVWETAEPRTGRK
jgi:hypothetical protein